MSTTLSRKRTVFDTLLDLMQLNTVFALHLQHGNIDKISTVNGTEVGSYKEFFDAACELGWVAEASSGDSIGIFAKTMPKRGVGGRNDYIRAGVALAYVVKVGIKPHDALQLWNDGVDVEAAYAILRGDIDRDMASSLATG